MRDLVTSDKLSLPSAAAPSAWAAPHVGLAGRAIASIAAFVMVAEVMIYVPAVANMRFNWLHNHMSAAYTAALVFDKAPTGLLSETMTRQLLASAGARLIVLDKNGTRRILASGDLPSKVDEVDDLRTWTWSGLLGAAFRSLTAPPNRVLTVLSSAPDDGSAIEVTMDEAPLKAAMAAFSQRVVIYSLFVSGMVALLAALTLHWMILRPVRRLTSSIMAFGEDPGDRTRIVRPSPHAHELGQAERALAVMQEALTLELSQKKNLANLGLAVAKINHDMRNMLTSAQILTDRLVDVSDPLVQRLAPKLVATLDRAIRFCQATLTYGRAVDEPPRPSVTSLRALTAEAAETVAPIAHGFVAVENAVPADLQVTADPEQMFRILLNLMRNGVEALERAGASPGHPATVRVEAWKEGTMTVIEISDTGPGLPMAMRPKLFSAFQNSTRPGGTGLGLAIVADLVRGHGGAIDLVSGPDEVGARFRITLPWLPAAR